MEGYITDELHSTQYHLSTNPLNSLKVKEGEKREHIMAKRTLNGQNVSTHLTSYFLGQYPTDKSCGVE